MPDTIREVVAVFDDVDALDTAVYTLQTRGFDRAAFSLLAAEKTVEQKLGHRYQQVKDVEDDPAVPRETFFSRVSRLEADYLPAPALAAVGALVTIGVGSILPVLVAAGAGGLLGAALIRLPVLGVSRPARNLPEPTEMPKKWAVGPEHRRTPADDKRLENIDF